MQTTKTNYKTVDLRLAVVDEPPISYDEPVYIECPNQDHVERTASCAVYTQHIHCFGCGLHVPYVIESLAVLLNITSHRAFSEARLYTTNNVFASRPKVKISPREHPLQKSLAAAYHEMLLGPRATRIYWFLERGITLEWVERACIGHTGDRFSIPVWDKDKNLITSIRFRRDDEYYIPEEGQSEAPKYSGMAGRNENAMYPEWLTPSVVGAGWCVVCEGELDALRLWVEDIPAISPTNGAGAVKYVVDFLKDLPQIKRVYLATDQDAAGDKAASDFMARAGDQFDLVERVVWDQQYKDVTELYKDGGYLVSKFGIDL